MTDTLLLIRPGRYAVSVSLGAAALLPGARLEYRPVFNGDVLSVSALMADTLCLSQGIMPQGLVIGVPCE